jgi:hypothetical protein
MLIEKQQSHDQKIFNIIQGGEDIDRVIIQHMQ